MINRFISSFLLILFFIITLLSSNNTVSATSWGEWNVISAPKESGAIYDIGAEIAPGKWRNNKSSSSCSWQISTSRSIEKDHRGLGISTVHLDAKDRWFRASSSCGTWTFVTNDSTPSAAWTNPTTLKTDGIYRVGAAIAPGEWRVTKDRFCWVYRLQDDLSRIEWDILDVGDSVTIEPSDYQVIIDGCELVPVDINSAPVANTNSGNTNGSSAACVIPPSGPWPPCASSGASTANSQPAPPQASGGSTNSCVIPKSGPWPPCATSGSNNTAASAATGATAASCVIPKTGPWPACARAGTGSNSSWTPSPTATPKPAALQPTNSNRQRAQVTRITDGDTIVVNIDGGLYSVRLIGIDTPENNQRCSAESTAALSNKIAGRWVELEKDKSNVDRYDRLLRYVYIDGRFVNGEMVNEGFAEAVEYPPDTKHANQLNSFEQDAQANRRGCLWNAPPTATPRPAPTQAPAPPRENCHSSYPTVCIPPPPPDLDCGDIPYRNFRVVGSDPHRFDRDKDGIGCESR